MVCSITHNRFLVVNLQNQARRRTTVERNRSTSPGLARLSIEPQLRDVPSERRNSETASAFSAVSMALRSEFGNLNRTSPLAINHCGDTETNSERCQASRPADVTAILLPGIGWAD